MSAWIVMREYEDGDEKLCDAFDRTRGPKGTLDNVMRVHSLRPDAMVASKALYKAALHNPENTLPTWLQEVVGSYVSILNGADYSVTNHWANAAHLIGDPERARTIEAALHARQPEQALEGYALALLRYAEKLTLHPSRMTEDDVSGLRDAGLDDGQILEATQIIGYFNYVNRILNGLGVSNAGEMIGFY